MERPSHLPQAILHGGRRGLTPCLVPLTTRFLPLWADSSDATSFCSFNRHQGIGASADAPWTSGLTPKVSVCLSKKWAVNPRLSRSLRGLSP